MKNLVLILLIFTCMQTFAMDLNKYFGINSGLEDKIYSQCHKMTTSECFDSLSSSDSQEHNFYSLILYLGAHDESLNKADVFKLTIAKLVEKKHRDALLLYCWLLNRGEIFEQDYNESEYLITLYIESENDPLALFLLGEAKFNQAIKQEASFLFRIAESYLERSYALGSDEAGRLLAFMFFKYGNIREKEQAIKLLNNLIARGDNIAKRMQNDFSKAFQE